MDSQTYPAQYKPTMPQVNDMHVCYAVYLLVVVVRGLNIPLQETVSVFI